MYRQALQLCRATSKQPMSSARTPVQSRPSSAASAVHDSKINENEVGFFSWTLQLSSFMSSLGESLWE